METVHLLDIQKNYIMNELDECFIYSKCTIWRDLIKLYRAVMVAETFSGAHFNRSYHDSMIQIMLQIETGGAQ